MVVVNNGKPDVVVMDVNSYSAHVKRLHELEELSLLREAEIGIKEYHAGKTVRLKKGQTLVDVDSHDQVYR